MKITYRVKIKREIFRIYGNYKLYTETAFVAHCVATTVFIGELPAIEGAWVIIGYWANKNVAGYSTIHLVHPS